MSVSDDAYDAYDDMNDAPPMQLSPVLDPEHDPRCIELRNVSKFYPCRGGRKTVLDNLNVRIPRTMRLGVLGRNGAGKSTLCNLLAGAEYPSRGDIRYNGLRLSWPIGRGGIQTSLTGRNNVRFICRATGHDIDEAIAFVMDFAELGRYLDMPVKSYSSGMKSRLTIAMSMIAEYDCYLIDEGLNAGDKRFTARAYEFFKARFERSNMIIVTHNVNVMRSFCNTAGILDKGVLTLYDDLDEAAAIYAKL